MVKIPSIDELKKMSSDLLDSAKSVNISSMVDKIKTTMDSVSKKGVDVPIGDETIKTLFENINTTLEELTNAQLVQAQAIKKIQGQMKALAAVVTVLQKPESTVPPTEPDQK